VARALQSGVEQMAHLADIAADHLPWNGGPWRQGLCVVWRCYFLTSLGTLLPGQGAAGALIVRVLACRAKGLGLRGPARVCEGKANDDGRSDRDDLIDFLAEGPDAQRGIAPGDTMGNIREIAARYQTLLDLLASSQLLQGGASSVQQWASAHDVT
jgi:hypothetical protein